MNPATVRTECDRMRLYTIKYEIACQTMIEIWDEQITTKKTFVPRFSLLHSSRLIEGARVSNRLPKLFQVVYFVKKTT